MAGWITEVDPAMLGVRGFLQEDSGRSAEQQSLEGLNIGELFTFVRKAGRRFIDQANERLLAGPVADCLAPDPYAPPVAPSHAAMPVVGIVGSELHEYAHMTDSLARWIAVQGYNLLTFCAPGVAHAAARTYSLSPNRTGRSLGVEELPISADEPRSTAEYVEVAVRVPAPCRHCCDRATTVFAATAHVVVVLPGANPRHLDALGAAPVIVWADSTGAPGPDSSVLKRAYRVGKLAEVTRHIERILLADMPAVADPGSDKDEESADDFEMIED